LQHKSISGVQCIIGIYQFEVWNFPVELHRIHNLNTYMYGTVWPSIIYCGFYPTCRHRNLAPGISYKGTSLWWETWTNELKVRTVHPLRKCGHLRHSQGCPQFILQTTC